MDVKKCDRCGRIFERNKEGAYEGFKIMRFKYDIYTIVENADLKADLCEICSEGFDKWLAGDDAPATVNVDGSAVQKAFENIENNSFLSKRFLETR